MSQEGAAARTRWRDALVVLLLAGVIIAGLVHYGRGLGDDDAPDPTTTAQDSPAPSPSADQTASLESAPPTDPAAPAPPDATCWDGRATTSLRLCGLPEGARGLGWVFPSFARDRALCHQARPNDDSYPTVESYECFLRALGRPVTVTYDRVEDSSQVARWLLQRLGPERMHELAGRGGGRLIFKDGRVRPARITGLYQRFPYVVSVYADNPQAAHRAWKALVRMRAEENVRGVRAAG